MARLQPKGFQPFPGRGEIRNRKAKTFKGAGDAGVVEIIDDFRGGTFRTIYTVRFASAVYVLHAFQKKSKQGIATPNATCTSSNKGLVKPKDSIKTP